MLRCWPVDLYCWVVDSSILFAVLTRRCGLRCWLVGVYSVGHSFMGFVEMFDSIVWIELLTAWSVLWCWPVDIDWGVDPLRCMLSCWSIYWYWVACSLFYVFSIVDSFICVDSFVCIEFLMSSFWWSCWLVDMGWLWLVGSIKLQVSFAKELYERDDILQKRPIL